MVSKAEELCWEYKSIMDFMENNPGMYTMDDLREKVHKQICELMGLTYAETKAITNNCNNLDGSDLYFKLRDLKK
jgi:hypothetical protein